PRHPSSINTSTTRRTSTGAELSSLFFFQAEDGIRDRNVTGVQTCALPISARLSRVHRPLSRPHPHVSRLGCRVQSDRPPGRVWRSEERRVGKRVDLGGRSLMKKKEKRS